MNMAEIEIITLSLNDALHYQKAPHIGKQSYDPK